MQLVSWDEIAKTLRDDLFPQGQKVNHVAILGINGGGKTTLALRGILPHYENALILDTTGDPSEPMASYGEPLKKVGKIKGHRRLMVDDLSSASIQKVHRAMGKAFDQGNVGIYVDEVRQMSDKNYFGMQKALEYVWLFGRKRGVSLIGSTQAPRFVPSAFYDQSRMHFIFGMRDRRAMKRLAEISGDVDTLEAIIPNLNDFEFAYVNPRGDVVPSIYKL